MTLFGNDMNSVYRDACLYLTREVESITVRGISTLELIDVHLCLRHPILRFVSFKARAMSMKYFIGELCYFLAGRTDLASIAHYSKFWEKVSDDGATVNSSYGARLFALNGEGQVQFKYAIRCLEVDECSRKAVMAIYRPDDAKESLDNPCTMFLQFLIRHDEFRMFVYMRSNDIWLGTPYDVAFFTIVQEIAYVLLRKTYPKLRLGTYVHSTTSLHAYEKDWKSLAKLCEESDYEHIVAPPIGTVDVDSWFNDLLTYEKAKRGKIFYKSESVRTPFQDWCKKYLN